MSETKSERINLRVSKSEKEAIRKASELLNMEMSDFIREMVLNTARATVEKQERETLLEAMAETATVMVTRVPDGIPPVRFVLDTETGKAELVRENEGET